MCLGSQNTGVNELDNSQKNYPSSPTVPPRHRPFRGGGGGIILPNHSPLLIAEQFGTVTLSQTIARSESSRHPRRGARPFCLNSWLQSLRCAAHAAVVRESPGGEPVPLPPPRDDFERELTPDDDSPLPTHCLNRSLHHRRRSDARCERSSSRPAPTR